MHLEQDGFPRPFVTVDAVLTTLVRKGDRLELHVVFQRRPNAPHEGALALVGGFVHVDEDADADAAIGRVLAAKTGLDGIYFEQLRTFSGASRDGRGWSVSVAYLALVDHQRLLDRPAGTFETVRADDIPGLPAGSFAFDHAEIAMAGIGRLRGKGGYSTLPARLLPGEFTMEELRTTYDSVLGDAEGLHPGAFRRKVLDLGIVEETGGNAPHLGRKRGGGGKLFRLVPGSGTFDRRI